MNRLISILYVLLLATLCYAREDRTSLIPEPMEIEHLSGTFILSNDTKINLNSNDIIKSADLFKEFINKYYNVSLKKGSSKSNSIRLIYDSKIEQEAYILQVNERGVTVRGNEAGIFYGLQTLQQLIINENNQLKIPYISIKDKPRFPYRGFMLDESHTYHTEAYIKEFIDLLAAYKINTFHWHLTDNNGWRIEIKKYPELTKKGAWRNSLTIRTVPNFEDRLPHGGFYTQEQIKSIIQYAADRQITIIPEIDTPAHSTAALSVFPHLSCTGSPASVNYCVGNEETFNFLEDVFSEIIELFPSEFIHIGGDEANKTVWKNCPKCQERIKKEDLKDEYGLQSYFVHRIEKFINEKGRKIIGWDEIAEGGLSPSATVMAWNYEKIHAINAANSGNDVIMANGNYTYFSWPESKDINNEPVNFFGHKYLPLSMVYNYEPVLSEILPEKRKHIKGIQGCTWGTGYHRTKELLNYSVFPRLLAIAETGWSPKSKKDYNSFSERLPQRLYELDKKGVTFRIPEANGHDKVQVENDSLVVNLKEPVSGAQIYYTTDGKNPAVFGKVYNSVLKLPIPSTELQMKYLRHIPYLEIPIRYYTYPIPFNYIIQLPSGRMSAVYTVQTAERKYIEEAITFSRAQIGLEIAKIEAGGKVLNPVSVNSDGTTFYAEPTNWRSGFFPGSIWYLYELTKDSSLLKVAKKYTEALENSKNITGDPNVGLIIGNSYGNGLRLSDKESYENIILDAARSLSSRFHKPAGVIKSSNSLYSENKESYDVNINDLVNLGLLFQATKLSGDSSFYKMAVSHADKVLKNHFNLDGSINETVKFSSLTNNPINFKKSVSVRDYAFAIYSYALFYEETNNFSYAIQALKMFNYIKNHPVMPDDLIPYWNMESTRIPNEIRDVSSATIIASALYLIYMCNVDNSILYKNYADNIMRSLTSIVYLGTAGQNNHFLLRKPLDGPVHKTEVNDTPQSLADYYFLEALKRKHDIENMIINNGIN